MFEKLFVPHTDSEVHGSSIRPRKGVIIGAGQVGMACAYSLLIQDCFDELILQDIQSDRAEGEVMDLRHGVPLINPTDVKAGTVADVGRDADIIIITAGANQKPGETRLDLVERNVKIFKNLIADIVQYCPNAILLIVTNPVDIMTYVSLKLSGFPSSRVIGSGTVLDTARFRTLLAAKLDIDPRSVHAYIIGEHGDSEVAVWSKVNISGMYLCDGGWEGSPSAEDPQLQELFWQVKNAAYEIIQRKGYTSYAIGLAVTEIVKAILRSQERIFTVSSIVNGLYGIDEVCLSLPRVVNERGILKTVNLTLSDTERQQLTHSAKVLREVFDNLTL
ncbi:L-lactate dehydrogenase [Desertifilum sp. FACHB-1129]|uniref:L-lactate dehydrogenase n=2 Tax=Desertifilum tharense IPPAS B-1220 TaxID=1781255 RepID=A0A1E5QEB6_9CYAN|nr:MULTISPECIES: L-lactate dehydrogenase [Desertifilum]MDA0211516.1 L-lactate dehydrogenase [Cyanobacteria bacterium FC1]MBD2315034.1 L-lactate dehydrogenase [Desertifilum sp. FACHB-1129]MBD2324702.1 L-lactate dehydrogenase [Desertifilum sp. FACHB-866]MBD2334742.1 L-lactate dehydrogenase [Desertifilum sp. FACHB-868]OEJ72998.1 L-lactate dehydrogenase [Desertifilum tharense IPPAS B-1220]